MKPMKTMFVLYLVAAAVLGFWVALRPTASQTLTEGLPSLNEALVKMPELGSIVQLPLRDLYGRSIVRAENVPVIAMPSCQSCSIRRMNWLVLKSVSKAPVVLVFPEKPDDKYPEIKGSHFRVVVEGPKPILSFPLHDAGPNCVWLDRFDKVVRTDRSFAIDRTEQPWRRPL